MTETSCREYNSILRRPGSNRIDLCFTISMGHIRDILQSEVGAIKQATDHARVVVGINDVQCYQQVIKSSAVDKDATQLTAETVSQNASHRHRYVYKLFTPQAEIGINLRSVM